MDLKVILLNKTVLTDGRKGPILTPISMDIESIINEIDETVPTPRFRVGNKILTKEFLTELASTHSVAKEAFEEKVKVEEPIITPIVAEDTVIKTNTTNIVQGNKVNKWDKKNQQNQQNQNTTTVVAEAVVEEPKVEESATTEETTTI